MATACYRSTTLAPEDAFPAKNPFQLTCAELSAVHSLVKTSCHFQPGTAFPLVVQLKDLGGAKASVTVNYFAMSIEVTVLPLHEGL